MILLNYIPDDTYTVPGYIKANWPAHGDLRFKYRPMLAEERGDLRRSSTMSDEVYYPAAAKILQPFIREWNLVSKDSKPAPITENAIRRLSPMMLDRLINIVAGWGVSDIDPAWPDELKQQMAGLTVESMKTHAPPGDIMEDAEVKNSSAAPS